MTSGDEQSSTPSAAGARADAWDAYLAGLEKRDGLADPEGHPYVTANPDEMRALSPEDCHERAQVLAAWGMKVQRVANTYAARARWCKASIDKLLLPVMARTTGVYSAEERRGLAMEACPEARDLEKYRVVAEAMCDRLQFVPARLEESRRTYVAMADTRRRRG
jgi:hypothetical protein